MMGIEMNGDFDLYDWVEKQTQANKSLYAIVDPLSKWGPHRVFVQLGGQGSAPLLSLEVLRNAEDGPWLLPVNSEFLQWWFDDNHAESGILIAADSRENLRDHFSSLFQAILLGEKVFFPFYRPDYLGSLLTRMLPEEIDELLAGHTLLLGSIDGWKSYQSQENQVYSLHSTPWWVIKEHHLSKDANLKLLTNNVESWLWQKKPSLMLANLERDSISFASRFQSIFSSLDETPSLNRRVLISAISAVYGEATITQPNVKSAMTETQDDELLFALKQTFAQIKDITNDD